MVDPRYFAPADIAGAYQRGLAFHEQRQEAQGRRKLGDLLPRAMEGDAAARNEIAGIDPGLFIKLDDRQRAQAKEEVADLTAAVRWADNPEKWAYVQQHFGQKGIDLSPYAFEDRERGLVSLGQIGSYLESAPKSEYRSIEAGGSLIDVSGGHPRVVIAPNEGGHPTGSPVQSAGNVPQGAADMLRNNPSLAPQFDEKYGPGASQRVLGGQMGSVPSGGFPR